MIMKLLLSSAKNKKRNKKKQKTCSLGEVKAADLMSDTGELHKFSVYSLSEGQKLGSVLIYFVFSFRISCFITFRVHR